MRPSTLFVVLPAALLTVGLAVANRVPVRVSLDPFSREAPALAFDAPLWALILGAALIGLLAGWLAAWWDQGRFRLAARAHRLRAERLERSLRKAEREAGRAGTA